MFADYKQNSQPEKKTPPTLEKEAFIHLSEKKLSIGKVEKKTRLSYQDVHLQSIAKELARVRNFRIQAKNQKIISSNDEKCSLLLIRKL